MKHFVVTTLMLCLFASFASAQETVWVEDSVKKYQIPVGICSWEEIKSGEFYPEMKAFYDTYVPSEINLKDIASVMQSAFPEYQMNIIVWFGAWCGDSQEHLPAFIRCCEKMAAENDFVIHYTLIGVDRNKKTGVADLDTAHIQKVPTFSVSLQKIDRDQVVETLPVGRIVEFPEKTIEEDIYMMLAKELKYNPR